MREQKQQEQQEEKEQECGQKKLDGKEKDQIQTLEETQISMKLPLNNMSSKGIEDEEMPSMVTISSLSKIDESENDMKNDEEKNLVSAETNSVNSPSRKEDDNDSDSVCVIDDDDEDDDGDVDRDVDGDADGLSFDEDDESSSYRDDDESEEMDRDHYSDNHDRRNVRNIRRADDEDDEEEADEEEEEEEEEVEEVEEYDSEVDGFDGGSDDLVLRHSNGLTKRHKERSASLQDLSLIKEGLPKNKTNVNPFSQKARYERNQFTKDRRTPGKQYSHVESKVKKYIMDMAQQRRISGERRKRAQEAAKHKNQEATETQIHRNDDVVLTCKTIKNYTEKTLKEVVKYEEIESDEMYVMPPNLENGEIHIFSRHPMDNNQQIMHHEEMEVDPINIEIHNKDEKVNKINGSVMNDNQNYILEKKGILRCEDKPVLNGEGPSNTVCNLRTLSYDEYMKGTINNEIHEEVIHDDGVVEVMQDITEKSNNNDTDSACVLRIENISRNYNNEEKMPNIYHNIQKPITLVNQSTETNYHENLEVKSLRLQLEKKNSQLDNLRDAFQKTMSENMSMKLEMDNLKKMLTYYQEQQKPVPETKVIAVQTELPVLVSNTAVVDSKSNEQKVDPRLVTNSMISTISSQWSDSIESATISMEPPPNVTNALNSDESMHQQSKTPSKQKNSFSRAFVTSSRILQTLSNITHGKSKSDNKYSCKYSKTISEEATEANASAETEKPQFVEVGSRKRKATDSAENSNSAHPFKIPHTSKSNWESGKQKMNSSEDDCVNVDDENNTDVEGEQNDNDDIRESDDDVKVFVYPEDDQSKEHSFLIQAREVTSNHKTGVRECGPYLLGNIEVYMTEMNGTINIWGKELSKNNANQNIEEMETSTRSKDLQPNFRWQSTPRIFNNQSTTSTSKKSRVLPRFSQQQKQHSCDINNTIVDCESCHSHNHRLSWPSCHHSEQHTENQHTCCSPSVRVEENHCGCAHKMARRSAALSTCCNSSKSTDGRQYISPNIYQENNSLCCYNIHHSHCRNAAKEESCRCQSFVRRHSFNPTDEEDNESNVEENAHNASKPCHSPQEKSSHSCTDTKLVPPCMNNGKNNGGGCSEASVIQNESDPLIFQKQNPEAPEVRKRRSNGKKVRGLIMDLLKGCGDCRTTIPINKSSLRNNTSVYEPSTSAQQKIACSPSQQSCSLRSNEKCASCRSRSDKTAEIEAQLEFFRIEMDKLRSRSDTLREMLNTLRNADIIN
ncbi:PREDICTED: MATH and LRR domain-containing protein PFE0570w-like [Ceratosolen solmsi marchali]|uniref:MATH and LRR domain-containing protein PFE0570w-like n=1 Tax=Ceratosolen solmsi marchali TaxID=326594 RepID=A0AAJ6VMK9_9HYME|nr:PREDICTED: MATH and LRR domain-containing protein PFE0570w-like [Ceratosolen solmsi marchali]